MNKTLLCMLLIIAIGFADGILLSAKELGCIEESDGYYYCLTDSVLEKISVEFTDTVKCYRNKNSTSPEFNMGCYTIAKVTQSNKVKLFFTQVAGEYITDDTVQDVTRTETLDAGNYYDAYVNPEFIERANCMMTEEIAGTVEEYNCGHNGERMTANGRILMDSSDVTLLLEEKVSGADILQLLWQNWVYVLLVLAIVIVIYSIIKKH